MKQKFTFLTKLMLLLCALIAGGGTMWGQSDYATNYDGNITLSTSGGTNASTCTVTIGSNSYDGIKAGTSKNSGAVVIAVPAGTKYLHVHTASWNGDNTTVSVSSGTPSSISLTNDTGISGNGTSYTISSSDDASTSYYKVITFSTPLALNTNVTISSPKKKRFVIWGVTAESICATPTFSPVAGEVTKNSSVTISSTTTGSTIYYTTDNTTPTTSSAHGTAGEASASVTVTDDVTIKAIAVKSGMANSIVGTAEYTIAKADNSITFTGDITSKDIALTGGSAVSSFDIGAITSSEYGTPTFAVKSTTNLTEGTDFSLNSSTGVLSFTNTYKGIIVVTASVAATETYKAASKDLTINCSGDLRTPVYSFNATETLAIGSTITVANGENVESDGDITLETSNSGIATVNNTTGVIEAVAAGSCTITVSTAAGTYYSASSTSFTLNVIDYVVLPFNWTGGTSSEIDAITGISIDGLDDYAPGNAPYRIKMESADDYILIKTNAQPVKVLIGVKMIGGATTSKIKVQESADGSVFKDVNELTISGAQNAILNLATTNSFATTTRYVKIIKSVHGSNIGVGPIMITDFDGFDVTLNASGYATFASTYALDFSDDSEYSAWQITGIDGENITFSQITGTVAAGTGVLLKGTASSSINIPVALSGSNISATNKLEGITSATKVDANEYYGLSGNKFVKVNAGTVPAGKALLPASEVSSARELKFVFEDETTGISNLTPALSEGEGAVYDLQGRKVTKPVKGGLYIVNGKKVIM